MAPKKTTLLLTAVLLVTGLASANAETSINGLDDEVWLNEGADQKVQFEVKFSENCDEENREVSVNDDKIEGDEVEEKDYVYNYTFSDFEESEVYEITACEDQDEDYVKSTAAVNAGFLELELEVPSETFYEGETFEAVVETSLTNDEMEVPDVDYSYFFNDEEFEDIEDEGTFELEAKDENYETLTVKASSEEMGFKVEESEAVDFEPYWRVEDVILSADSTITDDTVKYRHLSDLEVEFTVMKKGEGESGIAESDFIFDHDNLDTQRWFEKERDSGGSYTLEMDSTPVLDLEPDQSTEASIIVDVEDKKLDIVEDLKIERDVEFAGSVLNVRNNNVDADFEVEDGDRIRSFSTEDGFFEQYIETGEVDSMTIEFPEARLRLADMGVDKEDPGDLSYEYYDDVEDTNVDFEQDEFLDFRPVNLVTFISNYNFRADEEGRETGAEMEFDTSDIRPQDIVVYECNEWTFRAEECSGEWEELDDNYVGLTSGATWKADFPITPLESDRFSHDEGVLSNAYLVGVPEGIDAALTLEDSLDVSGSDLEAGDSFEVSGTIIDDSRGQAVNGADIVLELVGDSNEYSFETSTDSDGGFSFEEYIESADEYKVRLAAEREPYESFSEEQSSAIEVYYDVGLSVESGEDPELNMGEESVIEYEVKNTGQTMIGDLETEVSGLEEDEYSIESDLDELEASETSELILTYDVPEDLESPPSIEVTVFGDADGEAVENSATVHTQVDRVVEEESDTEDEEDSDTQTSSIDVPDTEELQRATGDFINSQSDMNLALGLMLVFAMILAVAVKQKKNSSEPDRMRGRMGDNSRVQKPSVAPQKVEPEQLEESNSGQKNEDEVEKDDSEEAGSEESKGSNVCDICGEEFDTESGLDLHKQALH